MHAGFFLKSINSLRFALQLKIEYYCNSRSPRHLFALATFVRKRFKMKNRKPSDLLPKIEGSKNNEDWIALDLGNIALHIFTPVTRQYVDLETLWTVGPQYDDLVNEKDTDIIQLLSQFSSSTTTTSSIPKPKK